MVEIEINGKKVEAAPGSMIIEVADDNNVRIPRFCYHKKLSVAANCRMCLVEVGDMRKPMPACATPVSQGMKVFTRSKMALDAQRAVMEFLLINHPLDCPVCDQGGECELQDLSMGYGQDISRFHLGKRSVADKNIGPLIETEMTRCIHCTRCVRFGKEIAGLHELGVMNRGEHLEISTFIEKAIVSELSGNMIDLCPVGALTSKPYRFSARAWELSQRSSIAPHDCVGSHIAAHVIHNEVKRVVPKECETINETWISDRDRFSYQGLYHADRLLAPKIKKNGEWIETDWQTALQFAADALNAVKAESGANAVGALISPSATNEEFYLLQKLMRIFGSNNIDHRLQQQDFSHEESSLHFPHMGVDIADINHADTIFLIGSAIRKEQPIIAHRIRMATTQNSTQVLVLNPIDFPLQFKVAAKQIVPGGDLLQGLAKVAKALCEIKHISAEGELGQFLATVSVDEIATEQARYLSKATKGIMFLGALALNHPQAAAISSVASFISQHSSMSLGLLTPGANSAGAYLMGALPKQGLHAEAMLKNQLKALLLVGIEAEYDMASSHQALQTLSKTPCVIALHAYQTQEMLKYAHVMLPITPFAEMAGTFVNAEGKWQTFSAASNPQGQSRPAWKVLRVLANLLGLDDFEYADLQALQDEIHALVIDKTRHPHRFAFKTPLVPLPKGIIRIGPAPIYAQDALVRRADALQQTPDGLFTGVHMNRGQAIALGVSECLTVNVHQDTHVFQLPLILDETIPMNAVYLASGMRETMGLGASYQSIHIEQGSGYE